LRAAAACRIVVVVADLRVPLALRMDADMTQRLRQLLDRIDTATAALGDHMAALHEQTARQREAHERLTREYWSSNKRARLLEDHTAEHGELAAENAQLQARVDEMGTRLAVVLKKIQALQDALRHG